MKLKLDFYDALCSTRVFKINGVEADYEDFGKKYDASPETAEPYGCGDMKFFPKPPTNKVLQKYQITVDEYKLVCNRLEEGLSFGNCGWCV